MRQNFDKNTFQRLVKGYINFSGGLGMNINLPWGKDFFGVSLPDAWQLKKHARVAVFPDGGATFPKMGFK